MTVYVVMELQDLEMKGSAEQLAMDLMSPFVGHRKTGAGVPYPMLLRAVPNPLREEDPTGIILGATSTDGRCFTIKDAPVLKPGPDDDDAGGLEDPTVHAFAEQDFLVYYTGLSRGRGQSSLLSARGNLDSVKKFKPQMSAPEGEGNIKEATLVPAPDGTWRLFYEYAAEDASRIGMARGPNPDGPWEWHSQPFDVRGDGWDNWHLSTGPIVRLPGKDPVMFYNGATRDARWRIGWISFDPTYEKVTGRGVEPLLVPPPVDDRDAVDIAFAASALVEDEGIWLYYSLEDRRLARARIAVF